MWVYDRASLRFLAANDAALKHYGYSREQFLTMTILDIRPPELREDVEREVRGQIESGPGRQWQHTKADGSFISVEVFTRALTHEGRSAALVAVLDVTERMRTESELRQTRAFLDAVVENIPAMLFVKEAEEHRFILFNKAGEELLGVPRAGLIGRNDHDLFPKREADQFVARDRAVLHSGELQITEEERIHTPHNGLRLLRTKKIAIPDDSGRPKYLLGISEDITERKRAEGRITHMAHHDSMTGLANRVLLRERLEHALARMLEQESRLAVLYVDLDFFKDVNDALGHPVGDALLRMAAERLRGCVRDGDTVARLGGDEFAIIQDSIRDDEQATDLAKRIAAVIGAPFQVEGHDVTLSASIGIAMAPRDGSDPDTLLKFADMALYAAKTDGRRTFRFFEAEMNERLHARRAMEIDLRLAFARGEFELYYQPTIDIASGRVVGVEALLRWHHPERGKHRADRAAGRLGAAPGVHRGGALARRRHRRRQSLAASVQERQPGPDRHCGARRRRAAATPARARNHRIRAVAGEREQPGDPASAARPRRACRARRFRYRLFIAELSARVSVRPDQDRRVLRQGTAAQRGVRLNRARHGRPRARSAHGNDGGRRGNTRAARGVARLRLHGGAGLSVQPTVARRRTARTLGAPPPVCRAGGIAVGRISCRWAA